LKAFVSSIPVSYGLTSIYLGEKVQFSDHAQAKNYLSDFDTGKKINSTELKHKIIYEAIYSDGAMFEREDLNINEALKLHEEVGRVAEYFKAILNNK